MFENRSFDNVLGRLYEPGEVSSFEGVLGKELSNPIPGWAEHGAGRQAVDYGVAGDMNMSVAAQPPRSRHGGVRCRGGSMAQATTWNGSAQRTAFGGPAGHDPGDPVSHVGGHVGQLGGALGAALVEEHPEGGVVAARAGPHQPAGVVIDNHDHVAVPALVGDLVYPDPTQPVEPVDASVDVGVDAGDDRPDAAPRDPQQLADRRRGGSHRQPGGQIVEVPGVSGAVTPPGDRDDRWAMSTATDPGCVSLDEHLRRPQTQRPPPTAPLAAVIAR
jgi:hypothetical protein